MKNKTIFFKKWSSTGHLDFHGDKSKQYTINKSGAQNHHLSFFGLYVAFSDQINPSYSAGCLTKP